MRRNIIQIVEAISDYRREITTNQGSIYIAAATETSGTASVIDHYSIEVSRIFSSHDKYHT